MYNQYDDILTPEELGEILKTGKNTVYGLLHSGKIASFKIGRNYKIPKNAVESYIVSESQMYYKEINRYGNPHSGHFQNS